MDLARLFDIAGWIVLPGWLLLVFLPHWKWTQTVTAVLLPAILAVIYLVLFIQYFGQVPEGFGAFGSLAGVKAALSVDGMLLAGWIHYLAFDLFVGSWEVRDAGRVGVHHLLVIPCLVFTFMMGPVGLLAYLVLRGLLTRNLMIPGPAERAAPAA
jgi:hypothetical protein